jgi:hypothetical protein
MIHVNKKKRGEAPIWAINWSETELFEYFSENE